MAFPADSLFARIIGPLTTVENVTALGGDPKAWVDNFYAKEPSHYEEAIAYGSRYWEYANYYDRVKTYYYWHASDIDRAQEYLSKGHELALNYRDTYAPTGNVSGHWAMTVGVALHYILTGDEKSKTWVLNVGNTFAIPYYVDNLDNLNGEMDNRQQARCLEAWSLCWALTGDARWSTLLRNGLTDILKTQDPSGAYLFNNGVQNGENKPFMVGLLNDAMILYARLFEADSRINDSLRRACEYMWSNNWLPAEQTFVYQEGPDPDEPPSADLNNLIVNGYAFVGMTDQAEQIFHGSMSAWIDGQKQFNQQYLQSYAAIAALGGMELVWDGASPPIPPEPEPDIDVETAKAQLVQAQGELTSAMACVNAALDALGGDTARKRRDRKYPPRDGRSTKGG